MTTQKTPAEASAAYAGWLERQPLAANTWRSVAPPAALYRAALTRVFRDSVAGL